MSGAGYKPEEQIIYDYRKMFGLSWEEWLQEPAEEFARNLIIINQENKFKRYKQEMENRKAKRI